MLDIVASKKVVMNEKRHLLVKFIGEYNLKCFIETGTYYGDTVEFMKTVGVPITSIELDDALFQRAKKRFANDKNVTIFKGQSFDVLNKIMPTMQLQSLIFLDAHYSGAETAKSDCPLIFELESLTKAHRHDHVIMIDNALDCLSVADYPSVGTVVDNLLKINPQYHIEMKNDYFRAFL